MDKGKIYELIRQIVYDVPDNIYKYSKPDEYWDDKEWAKITAVEKGFILIRELIENADIKRHKAAKKAKEDLNITKKIFLGKCPTFFNQADENMFFSALNSLPSFISVKGSGRDLILYYKSEMTNEEKIFLIGLLKRYGMKPLKELGESSFVND